MIVTGGIYICMNFSKALRDRWVQAQLLLLAVTGTLGPALDRAGPPPVRALGVALLLLGLGFAIWGARALGPALTPEPEPVADARLVQSGPYRLVRHPIYTGVALAVSGWTLAWSTWLVALGVGIVLLMFFSAKAGVEERWLRERFPGYDEYARRVRRKVLW
jgi:protein-S-isoprenylcysteine O-methyltransferase Ste14